ncbi:MAG TPA: sensor histidine kinase, partial [Acidobacteria bacterium]|nr:sensor histidine kinase [Acidobacteriota bacterium]
SKISHELRTPLTSILMFAEMVSDGHSDPSEQELCIEGIQREAYRLQVQIERLLEWGRMEAGQRRYERTRLDPGDIVEEAVEVFHGTAPGRDLPIAVELSHPLPAIEGDRDALEDALLNLLGNAFKYTGEEKRIAVGAAAEGDVVRLYVRDNGPGIPRREQRRIFQKFYRVDDRLSRAVEGAGLGLAIVHHVATGHGGRVEVDSEPGRGATFSILLPAAGEGEDTP